jgi:hypothetical protein
LLVGVGVDLIAAVLVVQVGFYPQRGLQLL